MFNKYLDLLVVAGLFGSSLTNGQTTSKCYCLSTSSNGCFPSVSTMTSTFGNSFMTILPYGAPCHDPYYNANECSVRQAGQHVSYNLVLSLASISIESEEVYTRLY